MRLKPARLALIVGGGVLSVLLAGLAFFRVSFAGGLRVAPRFDIGIWVERLPSHLPWVVPFMALTATLAALRAVVWGRTLPLDASGKMPSWRARFHALALGGFVQNAIPGHLGPLASAWVLSRAGGPPMPAALASLLLAKLLEFGALFGAMVLLAMVTRAQGIAGLPIGPMLWGGFVALLVFAIVLIGARRLAPRLADRLARRGRLPRVVAALHAIAGGLAAVHSPRRLLAGWLWAFAPVLACSLAYGLALRHMGGHAFLLGGGLIVGAVTFSAMTPGLPTAIGLYYLVCSATARALGVPDENAAALAALSHTATVITHILVGIIVAIAHHEGLRDLVRVRAAVSKAAPPVA